ncbi:Chorion class high-cysteine HCB protein 13, partial [Dysosmobacter welbionis]
HGLLHGRRHRYPGRHVHRRGPQVPEDLHGCREGGLPGRHSGTAAHPGEPAVR